VTSAESPALRWAHNETTYRYYALHQWRTACFGQGTTFGLSDRYNAKQIVYLVQEGVVHLLLSAFVQEGVVHLLFNAYKLLSARGAVIVDDYDYYQSCRNAIHDFFKAENIPLKDLRFANDVSLGLRPFWIKKD